MIRLISFTDQGEAWATELAGLLSGEASRCNRDMTLEDWTREAFQNRDVLIFVGAVGIAVRAVAPLVKSKVSDSPVLVMDVGRQFVIPILSGHLGGANSMARKIAAVAGVQPVITTATDIEGVFAVDEWARQQNCTVANPSAIKGISASLLAGGQVEVTTRWPVNGEPPPGVTLTLIPRIFALGLGCRRGTAFDQIEEAFRKLLERERVAEGTVCQVCSIDLKKDEPGILEFCRAHGFAFRTFTASQLASVPGEFPASEFVQEVTGVDNVCQRAAVLGSGGNLFGTRLTAPGVTMALAVSEYHPDWRWGD